MLKKRTEKNSSEVNKILIFFLLISEMNKMLKCLFSFYNRHTQTIFVYPYDQHTDSICVTSGICLTSLSIYVAKTCNQTLSHVSGCLTLLILMTSYHSSVTLNEDCKIS